MRAGSLTGYDTFGETTETDNPDGNVTTYGYDADGRQTTQTLPQYTPPSTPSGSATPITATSAKTYNALGQVSSETDPLQNTTTYTYDQLGDIATVTAPDNSVTSYTYDSAGDQLSVKGPVTGQETDATYDYLGRKLTSTQMESQPAAAAYTTRYSYGTGGWLSTETSPDLVPASYAYDAAGEVTSVTDGAQNKTGYKYDDLGRRTTVVSPDQTSQVTSYDATGNPVSVSDLDALGTTLRTRSATYDGNGNMLSSTSFRQFTTSYGYGPTGLLTQEVQPVSATGSITTSFGYDAAGNKTRYTDGNGNNWNYTYNSWGLPESQIEPATSAYTDSTFTTAYNADGQPVTVTEPGGVSITDSYNNRGELTGQSGSGADAATATRSFGYDSAGDLTSASTSNTASAGSNATSETFSYNSRGDILSAAGSGGTTSYTYNGDGLVTGVADAAGTTSYGYDNADRLQTLADPVTGTTATYSYTPNSQVASISYGSDTRTFSYNTLHQLTSDTLKTSAGATVASASYGYNADGQITSMNSTGLAGPASNTYGYDEAGRLTSWNNGTTTTSYEYDNNGNLTTDGSKTYTYDARNELTGDGTSAYSYTANGTLASQVTPSGTVTSTFDAYGDQVSAGSQAYNYDALGRVVSDTNTATASKYTFSYRGPTGTLASDGTSTYAWDPSGTVLDGVGVAGSTGGGVLALTNQHGDVTGQFTSSATAVSGSTGYDPWGNVTGSSGTVSGQLGYQSGWTDAATGKVAMGARWYSPATGGFTSRDTAAVNPVPDAAAADPFAYAGDDPLDQADPSGHNACPDGYCQQREWVAESAGCNLSCQRQDAIDQEQFYQQEERQAREQAASAGSCPWWDAWCDAVHVYHAAVNLVHRAENYAVREAKLVAALSVRLAREGVRSLDHAVKDAARWGAHAAAATWRRAESAGARVYHAEVALTKAELHVVGTAWHAVKRAATATVTFVKHHAAAITSIVVNVAVMAGCEATLGAVTAGAATMACSAIAGAASNAAAYAVTAAQTGHFSWSALGKTSLEGAAMGLAMGGLGELAGAAKSVLGSGVDEAASALSDSAVDEVGEGAANAAGESAGDATRATSPVSGGEDAGVGDGGSGGDSGGSGGDKGGSGGDAGGGASGGDSGSGSAAEDAGPSSETFFRTMSKEHYAELQATGRVSATRETFISPSGEYAAKYSGVTVRFSVRAGTTDALAGVGVRDSSALTGATYPDMPLVSSGWTSTSAFFKREGPSLINIGLGRGTALDMFNNAITGYEVVP